MTGPHRRVDVTGTAPPYWLAVVGRQDADRAAEVGRRAGLRVVGLSARRMPDAGALFAEFARAWRFPDWFGHNWSALEDCLGDLGWLPAPGYLAVLSDAGRLLAEQDPPVLGLFLDLLDRTGRHWATPIADGELWDRPEVPFHVLLVCDDDGERERVLRRARAGGDGGAG
jgi:hypothetical protein